jgi:hypothetical protein
MQNKKIPQQGNNNITQIEGDRVLKKNKPHGAGFLELSYEQQAKKWNQYYVGTPYATAYVTEDGRLSTPYIAGSYPDYQQHLNICKTMIEKGCVMVDCRDPRNFIVDKNGDVLPVDFGQIYMQDDKYYSTYLKVAEREITSIQSQSQSTPSKPLGLFKTTPEHSNAFQTVEDYIVELEKYKAILAKDAKNPLAHSKITQIDSFIQDTRTRIKNYNSGDKHAFAGYIESNQASIQILAQNRNTRPILYSLLLSLMVVPIICGAIQLALTKGNTYLLLTNVKGSEQRALDVQTQIVTTLKK